MFVAVLGASWYVCCCLTDSMLLFHWHRSMFVALSLTPQYVFCCFSGTLVCLLLFRWHIGMFVSVSVAPWYVSFCFSGTLVCLPMRTPHCTGALSPTLATTRAVRITTTTPMKQTWYVRVVFCILVHLWSRPGMSKLSSVVHLWSRAGMSKLFSVVMPHLQISCATCLVQ